MHSRSATFPLLLASALPLLATGNPAAAQTAFDLSNFQFEESIPWTSAGSGATDNHFAPDEIILGKYTLPFIFERWVFAAGGEVQDTPTVQGNDVYIADASGIVWKLDGRTGTPVWQANLSTLTGDPKSYSRNSPAIGTDVVIVGDQDSGSVYALSKQSGALVWKQSLSTDPDAVITSSPVIVNGRIYVGVASDDETKASTTPGFVPKFRGSVAALDEGNGSIFWQTYTVPEGYTGGGVWASNLAVDSVRQAVYVTAGNNYTVPPSVAACQSAATTPAQQDACLPTEDHIDSVFALDANTGAYKWSQRFTHVDTWTTSCLFFTKDPQTPCPTPTGLDTDFGAGANLFTVTRNGTTVDAVGAGQKSGAYFAMNRDTGEILWGTQVGPDGVVGGIEWGTATDGQRIYISEANSAYVETTLIPSGQKTNGGFWSAVDASTGQILWQTPTFSPAPIPGGKRTQPPPASGALTPAGGSVSVANGVMYAEDTAGDFVALDAATGQILRNFNSGGAAFNAPAIVDGALYWSSGYSTTGQTNNKVYSFWVGLH